MSLFSLDAGKAPFIGLTALVGVSLVLSVTWRAWKRTGHNLLPEAQSSAQAANHAISEHDAAEQSDSSSVSAGKHASVHEHNHHHHHHHHRHAKSLSSRSHGTQSTHDHNGNGEAERLLHPRAQTQPNYSGASHSRHDQGENARARDSSQILQFQDTHDEPTAMSHPYDHAEGTASSAKRHSGSGRAGSRNVSSQHADDPAPYSIDNSHGRNVQADDLQERLQKYIESYLEQHPEDLGDEPEPPLGEPYDRHEHRPRPVIEPPGKRYRDAALREAKLRKEAFENSKRAFKMGRKAEAKQLSDQGKLHDENAKMYNAQAASEIFAAYNPRYYSERKLSRCDLHGLHVEEAMAYAKDHLLACRRTGTVTTMLIVGKGSHSQNGSRIRPAILDMLSGTGGIVAGVHEKNEGCITVDFAPGR